MQQMNSSWFLGSSRNCYGEPRSINFVQCKDLWGRPIVALEESPECWCCVWAGSSCPCLLPTHYPVVSVVQIVVDSSAVAVWELWRIEFVSRVVGVSWHVWWVSTWNQNFAMECRHQSWGGPFRKSLRDNLLWSQFTADLSASVDRAAGIFRDRCLELDVPTLLEASTGFESGA